MSEERRQHDRFRLWIPATIEGAGDQTRLAVGHDLSQGGSLMVTNADVAVGTDITVHVAIPPDGSESLTLSGTVVRSERNEADPNGLWPYQIAVAFDKAAPELEALLRDHPQLVDGAAETGEQEP